MARRRRFGAATPRRLAQTVLADDARPRSPSIWCQRNHRAVGCATRRRRGETAPRPPPWRSLRHQPRRLGVHVSTASAPPRCPRLPVGCDVEAMGELVRERRQSRGNAVVGSAAERGKGRVGRASRSAPPVSWRAGVAGKGMGGLVGTRGADASGARSAGDRRHLDAPVLWTIGRDAGGLAARPAGATFPPLGSITSRRSTPRPQRDPAAATSQRAFMPLAPSPAWHAP
jgi:hypothetical protein